MGSVNPNLCPTHKCEMYRTRGGYICEECKSELYHRITNLKLKAAKLARQRYLSMFPNAAKLFEGL